MCACMCVEEGGGVMFGDKFVYVLILRSVCFDVSLKKGRVYIYIYTGNGGKHQHPFT